MYTAIQHTAKQHYTLSTATASAIHYYSHISLLHVHALLFHPSKTQSLAQLVCVLHLCHIMTTKAWCLPRKLNYDKVFSKKVLVHLVEVHNQQMKQQKMREPIFMPELHPIRIVFQVALSQWPIC